MVCSLHDINFFRIFAKNTLYVHICVWFESTGRIWKWAVIWNRVCTLKEHNNKFNWIQYQICYMNNILVANTLFECRLLLSGFRPHSFNKNANEYFDVNKFSIPIAIPIKQEKYCPIEWQTWNLSNKFCYLRCRWNTNMYYVALLVHGIDYVHLYEDVNPMNISHRHFTNRMVFWRMDRRNEICDKMHCRWHVPCLCAQVGECEKLKRFMAVFPIHLLLIWKFIILFKWIAIACARHLPRWQSSKSIIMEDSSLSILLQLGWTMSKHDAREWNHCERLFVCKVTNLWILELFFGAFEVDLRFIFCSTISIYEKFTRTI